MTTESDALMARTQALIADECDKLKAFLLKKNKDYGASATRPLRIFARSPNDEQIRVRIDDKLSRIANGTQDDEDTIKDLIGYLVILRVNHRLADEPVADAKAPEYSCPTTSETYAFNAGRNRRATHARAFHELFKIARPPVPSNLPDADIRRRLLLVMEEAFELVESCCADVQSTNFKWLEIVKAHAERAATAIKTMPIAIDMPKCVDALADIDYVTAGFADELGVDMLPIADEVHRANLAKMGGPKDPVTGKILKPAGWKGPAVAEELRKQGWQP